MYSIQRIKLNPQLILLLLTMFCDIYLGLRACTMQELINDPKIFWTFRSIPGLRLTPFRMASLASTVRIYSICLIITILNTWLVILPTSLFQKSFLSFEF